MSIKKQEQFIKKLTGYLVVLALGLMASPLSVILNFTPLVTSAQEDMCQVAVDVVLVMDRSGSMADGANPSFCEWEELEWVGGGGGSFQCVDYDETDLTEQECLAKPNPPQCNDPIFTEETQSKLYYAQTAANSFIDNLGMNDQSGLVSFADNAQLDKALSNDHIVTRTAVNSLTASGSTNIGDAIDFATQQFNSNGNSQAVKAMILLTDGKANRPNGPGHGEDPDDVQYAIDKATEAAGLDYRIFTIGLGSNSNINQTMLQDIADLTSAEYYHATNGDDLSGIYNQIAFEVCQYGSISGCKYNDLDNNGEIDQDEPTLSNWEFILTGGVNGPQTQTTDENGCFVFPNLLEGDYILSEADNVQQGDFVQTSPGGVYNISLNEGDNLEDYDFLNYFPICGNQILDEDEECDDGEQGSPTCSIDCTIIEQEPEPFCGDGEVNQLSEECDDGPQGSLTCSTECLTIEPEPGCNSSISGKKYNGNQEDEIYLQNWEVELYNDQQELLATAITDENGEYIFENLCLGSYIVQEVQQTGWEQIFPLEPSIYWSDTISEENTHLMNRDFSNILIETDGIQPGDIIINELMWMGANSSADEWIELRNMTDNPLDLTGCYITRTYLWEDVEMIGLNNFTDRTIEAHGYFLVSNYNEAMSKISIEPDIVNTNVFLPNSALQVKFFCNDTTIDVAGDGDYPLAGENGAPRKSMSRKLTPGDGTLVDNWCTASTQINWDTNATQLGTPGALNDCPLPVCGDEVQEGDEECDDGNTDDGDGCSAICEIEEVEEFASISGHKYQDEDGLVSTTDDWIPLQDWEIVLSDGEGFISTTTNSQGYYEFIDVLPGIYNLTEEIINGWVQLFGPANPFEVLSGGILSDQDFVNYYEGEEDQGGEEPPTNGGGGGGGGGDTRNVCGDGILNEQYEECDGKINVPEGYVCNNSCKLELESGVGGPEPEEGPKEETPTGGEEEAEEVVVITPPVEEIVAGETIAPTPEVGVPTENVGNGEVAGEQVELCANCNWWQWLIIILFLIIISIGYHILTKESENNNL